MGATRVGLKLTSEHHRRLKMLAAFQNVTMAEFIQELVDEQYRRYLESVELSKAGGKHERN